MKKRCLAAALALVLLAALLPISTSAADSDFTISNGVLTKYKGSGGKVTIPSGVTSIGSYAFYNCTTITSVSFPSSVTKIEQSAFSGCTGLTSIDIGNSVTSIGGSAFSGCKNLSVAYISSSVTSIGGSAFSGCKALTRVSFPTYSKLTTIGGSAFSNTGLTSVTIPGSVASIGYSAFSGCTSLSSVIIKEGVTSIEGSAFSGCIGLRSITIPDTVTSIGSYAFYCCSGLTRIISPDDGVPTSGDMVMGNGLTKIEQSAFSHCTGLTSLNFPESLTSIELWAFDNCTGLTSAYIPRSVTSIASRAFDNCKSLTVRGYEGSYAENFSRSNGIAFDPIITTFTFDLATPATFVEGTDVTLEGTISVDISKLNSIKVEVLEYGGFLAQTATITNINASTYRIGSSLNSKLDLGGLSQGKYLIRYTATAMNAASGTEYTAYFTVEPSLCTIQGAHTPGEYVRSSEYHPHSKYYRCSVCTREFCNEGDTEPELWSEWRQTKAPTCTTVGREVCNCLAHKSCTNIKSRELRALGHNWVNRQNVPTCTAAGQAWSECSRCSNTKNTLTLPALGHDYVLVHNTDSEAVYLCSLCDNGYTGQHGPAGTAQSGSLKARNGKELCWAITAKGQLALTSGFSQGETVLAACYDDKGAFLNAKLIQSFTATVKLDPNTPYVKLFWLDGAYSPLSLTHTVWTP